jgi:hypothetical protein
MPKELIGAARTAFVERVVGELHFRYKRVDFLAFSS